MDMFENLSDREKDNYFQSISAGLTSSGTYADVAGDSFTGLVNLTTLTSSGNASLNSANIPSLQSSAPAFTSLASLAGVRAYSTVATENAVIITSTILGSATVAPLSIIASTASQAFLQFSGVFISSASYTMASTNACVIPVYHESQRIWGYLGAFKALN